MAEKFTCTSCNTVIHRYYPEVNHYVSCPGCRRMWHGKPGEKLQHFRGASGDQYKSGVLSLGDVATIDGKQYTLIARLSFHADYREFSSEENRYYPETWNHAEWLLMSDDYQTRWLYSDAEGINLSYPVVPLNPGLPTNLRNYRFDQGSLKRVMEYGERRLVDFVGEYPEALSRQPFSFATYFRGSEEREVEWTGTIEKPDYIAFYGASKLSARELVKMFEGNKADSQITAKATRLDRKIFAVGALSFALVVMIIAYIFTLAAGGTTILHDEMAWRKDDITTLQHTTKTFTIPEKGTYEISVSSSFEPDNSDLDMNIYIVEAGTDQLVNVVATEFYKESGVDSDGKWTEKVTGDEAFFMAKSGGEYQAVMTVSNTTRARSGYVSLTIKQQYYGSYYLWSGFALLGLIVLLYKKMD